MTYRRRLERWTVVRLLPKMQRVVVGRYYHYSDADGHLKILRQLIPQAELIIIFDPRESS